MADTIALTEFPISARFAVIDAATGLIKRWGICSTELFARQAMLEGEKVLLDTVPNDRDRTLFFSPNGVDLIERPVLPVTVSKTTIAADGKDAAVITGLPSPIELRVDGAVHTVEGGRVEFTATMAASYVIAASLWPFLDWSITVTAR